MAQNARQAQLILERGWLGQSEIEYYYQNLSGGSHDLCAVLLQHSRLSPEQANLIRQQLHIEFSGAPARSGRSNPSESLARPATRRDSALEISVPSLAPSGLKANIVSGMSEVFKEDPWFKPHAELTWVKKDKLGEGGMGTVYRVHDACLGRDAALKLMNREGDARGLERFLREVKITARLDHPAIPPVYEAGKTAAGQHYLVMKVIEGETLADRIKKVHEGGRASKGELRLLLEALVRVAEALNYAHSLGIIHRDLKPENIMIGRFGEVLVMDWGIAKDLGESASSELDQLLECAVSREDLSAVGVTLSGSMIGTPGYMAPEQIDGESSEKSDIFALGVILTEILTGKRAIAGNTAVEKVAATASGNSRGPRDLLRSAPIELDYLARQALLSDPKRRLNGVEFIANLRHYLAGEDLENYPYSLLDRFFRWSGKHPAWIVGGAFFFVMASGLASVYQVVEQAEQARKAALAKANLASTSEANLKAALQRMSVLEGRVKRGIGEDELKEELKEILALSGENYDFCLAAAELCRTGQFYKDERAWLERAIKVSPPGYEALFLLHQQEMREYPNKRFFITKAARRLADAARERGEKNEFSLVIDSLALLQEGQAKEALELMKGLEAYSTKLSYGFLIRAVAKIKTGAFESALDDLNLAIQNDPGSPMAYAKRGYLKIDLGDLAGAMGDFQRSSKFDPDYGLAYCGRGIVERLQGKLQASLISFNLAIKKSPFLVRSYHNRAMTLELLGDNERALLDYGAAIKIAPDSVASLNNRAMLYKKLGRRGAALRDFNECLRQRADAVEPLCNRGLLKFEDGDLAGALADYEAALKADGDFAPAYLNRGLVKYERRQFEASILDFNKAIQLDSKIAEAYLNRGNAHGECGRFEKAFADFEIVLKLDPRNDRIYVSRAVAKSKSGDKSGALEDFTRALKFNPNSVLAYHFRGLVRDNLGDAKGALSDYENALKRKAELPQVHFYMGRLKGKQKDFQGALAAFNKALEYRPKYAKAYLERGVTWRKMGQFKRAYDDFSLAIQYDPRCFEAYSNRGGLKQRSGQNRAALEDFNKAIEIAPNFGEAYYNRGVTYGAMKQFRASIADFERAFELDGTNADALFNRGVSWLNLGDRRAAALDFERFLKVRPNSPKGSTLRPLILKHLGRKSRW